LDFFAPWTRIANPTDLVIRTDESKAYYWLDITQTGIPHWTAITASFNAAAQFITASVDDSYPVTVGFNLKRMGLADTTTYIVEDYNPATGRITVYNATPTAGRLAVVTGGSRHELMLYPQTGSLLHTATFQQDRDGYTGATDTYITAWYPDQNFGNSFELKIKNDDFFSPLIRFDLSTIPVGAMIRSAVLELYFTSRSREINIDLSAYRLLRPWMANQATWNQATVNTAWTQPGANGIGTDRQDAPQSSATIGQAGTWYSFNVREAVQAWVDNPDQNYGLIFKGQGPPSVIYSIASAEYSNVEFRPRLTVVYAEPLPTPTRTTTASPTATLTPTSNASPTPTHTTTPSLPNTPTFTATIADTAMPSPTPTESPVVPASSLTPTVTPTSTPSSGLTVYTFQQGIAGYNGTSDTFINAWEPTTNYANSTALWVKNDNYLSALLRFDLSSLPTDAVIDRATLSLFCLSRNQADRTLMATGYELLRPWTEDQATWQQASNGQPWATSGADGLTDRRSNMADLNIVDSDSTWFDFELTNLVQQWVARPETNHGVIIKGAGASSVIYFFASSEYENPNYRPRLTLWIGHRPRYAVGDGLYAFWGDIQNHTSYSDGKRLPADAYRSARIDDQEWNAYSQQFEAYYVPEHFVTLKGYEYTGSNGHLDVYNTDEFIRSPASLSEFYAWAAAQPETTLIQFNHPNCRGWPNFNNFAYNAAAAPHIQLVELCDWPQYLLALEQGWQVAPANNADHHGKDWGTIGVRTGVVASALTREAILEALQSRRTFAVLGYRTVLLMKANGQWMGSIVNSNNLSFNIWADSRSSARIQRLELWGGNGRSSSRIITTAEPGTTTYNWTMNISPATERFYFVRAILDDDGQAWTAPIWVAGAFLPTPTPLPTVTPTPMVQTLVLGSNAGGADTYISAWYPNTNYGTATELTLKNDGVFAPLLRFDLSSLPANAEVLQAALQTYVVSRSGSGAVTVGVYGVLRPWVGSQATWNLAATGSPWAAPGCQEPGSDRDPNPTNAGLLDVPSGWESFDVTTLVRRWLADPATNNGLLLRGQTSGSTYYYLASSEYGRIDNRPRLVISFVVRPPTQTATPTATSTATPTITVTQTNTPTPTATPSASATASPAGTASPTATSTATASLTATSTATPTMTATETPTLTPEAGATATTTATSSTSVPPPTEAASPTATEPTPSPTPSVTDSPTPTASATLTASPTPSATNTPTPTASATETASPTPSLSPTATNTPTPTATRTPSFGAITTMTLQQGVNGYSGAADTYITAWYPNNNYGAASRSVLKNDDFFAPLLRFDLSAIPYGSRVQSATLELYLMDRNRTTDMTALVYPIYRAWDDRQATWQLAASNTPWEAAGCNGPSDRGSEPAAIVALSNPGRWYSFDIAALVQGWVNDPTSNRGLVIKGAGSSSVLYYFASSDEVGLAWHPRLTITYRPLLP